MVAPLNSTSSFVPHFDTPMDSSSFLSTLPPDVMSHIAEFCVGNRVVVRAEEYKPIHYNTLTTYELTNARNFATLMPENRRGELANDKPLMKAFSALSWEDRLDAAYAEIAPLPSSPKYPTALSQKVCQKPNDPSSSQEKRYQIKIANGNRLEVKEEVKYSSGSWGRAYGNNPNHIDISNGKIKDFCVVSDKLMYVATDYALHLYDISDRTKIQKLQSHDLQFEQVMWDQDNKRLYGKKADGSSVALDFKSTKATPLPPSTPGSHKASKVGFIALSILKAFVIDGPYCAIRGFCAIISSDFAARCGIYITVGLVLGAIGGLVAMISLPIITSIGFFFALVGGSMLLTGAGLLTIALLVGSPICGMGGVFMSLKESLYDT